MDPYQACPCGSGKSFKWCCQPYFQQVEKARKQHQEGQQETALRTIKQLVEQNPGNAPIFGYYAELLYMSAMPDEADEAIQKAFAINPDFPFGHWLRGILRRDEGEIQGALIQFRKAAELYDPKANEILVEINSAIFDIEMRLNRPVAARAALDRALRIAPTLEQLQQAFATLYGTESRLPECARKAYTFRPAEPSRTESWKAILPETPHGRLGEAQAAFEKLTAQDANDAPAWFNLGVVRAWLGDHPRAIEALTKSIELDSDPEKVAEAGALIETLRCGLGMEEQSDYLEHRIFFQMQQPQPVVKLLEEWQHGNRLSGVQSDQQNGTFSALILEETPQFGLGVGAQVAKLASYMLIVGNIIRLWSSSKANVEKVADEVARKAAGAVAAPMQETGFSNFSDIAMEAMLFPTREAKINEIAPKLSEHAQNFIEDVWAHRPLKALAGVAPLEAAGQPALHKRLLGVVRFMQECFIGASPRVSDGENIQIIVTYDFDRLRRKLGLTPSGPAEGVESGLKFDVLSAAELAALKTEELNDTELDQAFRAALKLDARDLAGKLAGEIVNRPANAAQPDRYPYFNQLLQLAQAESDLPRVLSLLDQAEKADAETNGGSRRNDYSLRRGQTLAKQGELDRAFQVFSELVSREPNELKFYGPAAETMLSQKRAEWSLQFSEQGLAKARSQNNRDSEQYFMELVAAAKKLG